MAEDPSFRITGVAYYITMRTLDGKLLFADERIAEVLVSVVWGKRKELGFKQFGYVVMPDRCQLLVAPGEQDLSVANLVNHIQSISTVGINEHLGTFDFHWHGETSVEVVYTREALLSRLSKMHMAPVRAALVEAPEQYAYSSAAFYHGRYGRTQF